MDTLSAFLAVTGYGLVVAFTTLPVISVIAVLLGTKKAANGVWFTVSYAIGLAIVFTLASIGVDQIRWPRTRTPSGVLEVCAGALLLLVAGGWWLWSRRRSRHPKEESDSGFLRWMSSIGPVTCALVGFQFAFHPENLVLTVAAASRTAGLDGPGTVAVLVWFCVVGVSTVAVPTILYAASGEQARARLEAIQDWIRRHGSTLTIVLLLGVGLVLIGLGVYDIVTG